MEVEKLVWRPVNPHDRFCRRTAYNPFYAPDFLRCYCDPILAKYVDLDYLQESPTTYLSDELKEVIMDASLTTRLVDGKSASEVLLHLEHKSRPDKNVAIQLLTEAALALHFRWFSSKRVAIPLMVLVYNGVEDWDGDMLFQDLLPDLPVPLQPYVIQFQMFLTNLKRFLYGHLPGEPPTQAIVESLKRATDGTFIEYLPNIFEHVVRSDLDERRRLDLTRCISSYCTWGSGADPKYISNTIRSVFKRQEGINMAEIIQNDFALEWLEIGEAKGIEKGRAEGEAKGKVSGKAGTILTVLNARFKSVPQYVVDDINKRTDQIALDSLAAHAATCASIEEFANFLK